VTVSFGVGMSFQKVFRCKSDTVMPKASSLADKKAKARLYMARRTTVSGELLWGWWGRIGCIWGGRVTILEVAWGCSGFVIESQA